MARRVQAEGAAQVDAALCVGEGGYAAACCGGCRQKRLHCCMLRWVEAKVAALLPAAMGADGAGGAGCMLL